LVNAKIVYNERGVYLLKNCPQCGEHREILEHDSRYHLSKEQYNKPGTGSSVQTQFKDGCPYDCGLCPAHDQHTCIGLIEIVSRCNLDCAMCFARSSGGQDLSLAHIAKMMDFYLQAENGSVEILQISGGEPTLHADILEIIQMAKDKGIKYVMLNTNGIRLAEDEAFVRALAGFKGGFEVYLQFDGLDDRVYEKLRHKKLAETKQRALTNCTKYGVPVTLVCTVVEKVNDHLVGEVLAYGMNTRCVRGVNFQPLGYYGNTVPTLERITLSGVLKAIETQTQQMIRMDDFIPLPCNVERVAITYLFRDQGGFVPITRDKDLSPFKNLIGNTFFFTIENTLQSFKETSTIFNRGDCCDLITDIKKFLPRNFILQSSQEKMKFVDENTFRISVSSFVDAYNFDMKSMQKECVHILTPDLKRIPFSAYNMIHRAKSDANLL
jgi:uncharacterized radical SAM superfamily Fe-S cluster-containing enzyme